MVRSISSARTGTATRTSRTARGRERVISALRRMMMGRQTAPYHTALAVSCQAKPCKPAAPARARSNPCWRCGLVEKCYNAFRHPYSVGRLPYPARPSPAVMPSGVECDTLTIVGVGLIGGSVGLAAKRYGVARHVLGVGRSSDSLTRARLLGTIDEGFLDLAAAAARSDVVVVCTPVDRIAADVLAAAAPCRPGTLLTDAGSTKAAIVDALDGRLPVGVAFVGSHPLAGSEKNGAEHARADLFEGRLVVVTPSPQSDPGAVERTCAFWQALGALTRRMTPEEHDRALAMTSHLPHLVAAALAGMLPPELVDLTSTGFRDTTRIAAGDPALWTGIFHQNRVAVLDALDNLTDRLMWFHQALLEGDRTTLDNLLDQGKKVRDALGNRLPDA